MKQQILKKEKKNKEPRLCCKEKRKEKKRRKRLKYSIQASKESLKLRKVSKLSLLLSFLIDKLFFLSDH